MVFRCDEMENFLLQHCSSSQDAHVCPIWEHYHKLCRDSSHNIGHLAWKSLNIKHDSPFWEGFLEIFAIFQVWYFFIVTMWYNMTSREGFTLFWSFLISLNFLYPFQLFSKRRAWRFLAQGRALLNLQWISDEISYCKTKNDFSKKSWAIDHVPVDQI